MRLLMFAAIAIGFFLAPANARAQSEQQLAFAEDDPLTISAESDATTAAATVVVVNSGPRIDELTFSAVSADPDAPEISVAASAGSAVPANNAAPIELTFTSADPLENFSGHLVAATDVGAAERDLEIDAKNELPFSVNLIIFGSFAIAVGLVAIRAGTLWKLLGHRLGSPSWEFSKSWASTFTVIGALLGTVLASLVLPETPERFSKETLAGMNLIFGVAILLAPIAFSATEAPREVKDPTKPTEPAQIQPQGTVVGYLGASALTLGGVTGQLVTIFFLLSEIEAKGALPDEALVLLFVMLAIAFLLTLSYAWRTMGWTARHRAEAPRFSEGMTMEQRAAVAGRPLDSWPLL